MVLKIQTSSAAAARWSSPGQLRVCLSQQHLNMGTEVSTQLGTAVSTTGWVAPSSKMLWNRNLPDCDKNLFYFGMFAYTS